MSYDNLNINAGLTFLWRPEIRLIFRIGRMPLIFQIILYLVKYLTNWIFSNVLAIKFNSFIDERKYCQQSCMSEGSPYYD